MATTLNEYHHIVIVIAFSIQWLLCRQEIDIYTQTQPHIHRSYSFQIIQNVWDLHKYKQFTTSFSHPFPLIQNKAHKKKDYFGEFYQFKVEFHSLAKKSNPEKTTTAIIIIIIIIIVIMAKSMNLEFYERALGESATIIYIYRL